MKAFLFVCIAAACILQAAEASLVKDTFSRLLRRRRRALGAACDVGSPCASPDEYCHAANDMTCDGTGECRPKPEMCIEIFEPVCGCDGSTHSNGCMALSAGSNVAHEGECG